MPGRRTLTATTRPSVVTALWTCAIEAAPIGIGSKLSKSWSSGASNELSTTADRLERRGREVVLQRERFSAASCSDEVRAGRQGLAELDRRRADRLQRRRVIGRRRDARPEARDPHQPADLRRRERVVFDPAQRPMAGQRPAPFQQTPQVGDVRSSWPECELKSSIRCEWSTRPPSIGSAAARTKPASRRPLRGTARGAESAGSIRRDICSSPRRRRSPCRASE